MNWGREGGGEERELEEETSLEEKINFIITHSGDKMNKI